MRGFVVIFGEEDQPGLTKSLAICLRALARPTHRTARLVLPAMGVAIGHTGPAQVTAQQPGYAADRQIVAVVEGEPLLPAGMAAELEALRQAFNEHVATLCALGGPLNLALNAYPKGRNAFPRVSSYHYADWLRGPFRPLLFDVLTDGRTQARPYFDQTTVQRWLHERMAGQNHAPKLAALLALELTIRSLIEQDDD